VIPRLEDAGFRVLVPDLVGFGRSDKPAQLADFTHERHVEWMTAWVRALDLTSVALFGHNWGGMIACRVVAADPERFEALGVFNSPALPCGDIEPPEKFKEYLDFARTSPTFQSSAIVQIGTHRELSDSEKAAYDAPFPDDSYTKGPRQFPALAPFWPGNPDIEANVQAWQVLGRWEKPFVAVTGRDDPLTVDQQDIFHARIPGARNRDIVVIEGAGHYAIEDDPEQCSDIIAEVSPS
jgi:haloalkane dehalogenase